MQDQKPLPLRVNGERLWQRHESLAEIGAIDGGGCCRLCMTEADGQARDRLAQWYNDASLTLQVDRVGNMFGIRDAADPTRPMVLSGSHLDTQPHGGRFDGVSGVLCALEAIETMNDHGIQTSAPVAVVNWTNEEGVRYAPGLTGSSWFVGTLSDDDVLGATAEDGARFATDAQRLGYLGQARPTDFSVGAYYELHIEQGPILENEGLQIGVVESVQGLRWLDVEVTGADAHAGTTPLDQRQDSILASADMIVALHALGLRYAPEARVSVGRMKPQTDGASTIVGRTRFVIDVRHPNNATLDILVAECRELCAASARERHCRVRIEQCLAIEPSLFDAACVSRVARAADALGYPHRHMTSGALHDASNLARVVPSAMIFVPCAGGISHNVAERAEPADLEAGANVLLQVMLETASADTGMGSGYW